MKSMYDLELNETLPAEMQWGLRTDITRVPGGWIYQSIIRAYNGGDTHLVPVFVPFNNEFKPSQHGTDKE